MMVSEICNSLKEEKEDASSTNCVLEERDKITLKNKNRNKNKERNAHLRGVPDLFVLFSQSKHRRRLRRRKRERERERVMRFGASTKEKSDDDGELCRFCVSTTLQKRDTTTKKGKKRSSKEKERERKKKQTDILKP